MVGEKLTPCAAGTTAGKGDGASSPQPGGRAGGCGGSRRFLIPPVPLSALWVDAMNRPVERIWGRSIHVALAGLFLCRVCSQAGSWLSPQTRVVAQELHVPRRGQLAGTPRDLRGCWSPEHIPHSRGIHGQDGL